MRNSIFGGGIDIMETNQKKRGRGSFGVDERNIRAVAERALEWLVCTGVIPVTYEIDSEVEGLLRPVVPVPESLKLYVRITPAGDLEYEARFQRSISVLSGLGTMSGTGDAPKVLVWCRGEYTPTSTGKLVNIAVVIRY